MRHVCDLPAARQGEATVGWRREELCQADIRLLAEDLGGDAQHGVHGVRELRHASHVVPVEVLCVILCPWWRRLRHDEGVVANERGQVGDSSLSAHGEGEVKVVTRVTEAKGLPRLAARESEGTGYRVQGTGYRVQDIGYRARVQGAGYRVQGR